MTSALDAIIPAKPTSPEAPAPALRRAKNPAEPRRPQAHMSSVRRPAAPSPQRSPRTRLGTRTLGDRRHGESPSRMARFGATLL